MPDSSNEDDQKKVDFTSRMWAEAQPGSSRCTPSRQGYCGYCRVLYSNLDQHLSSLKHLDSVQASSTDSRTRLTLLERFLEDVRQHHPHHYKDPRPSHADLPSVSSPPLPREMLDDICVSDDNTALGTCQHLSSSDHASYQPANQEDDHKHSQSDDGFTEGPIQERMSAPFREQEEGGTATIGHTHASLTQTPPSNTETLPPVHRKAHRKTNRRKTNSSSSSSPPCNYPASGPCMDIDPRPHPCHGVTSSSCWQEDSESFHFSLPISMETQSDDWDSPVQVVLGQTPVHVRQTEEADLSHLMDTQVDLEEQAYSQQLNATLQSKCGPGGGAKQDQGFWTLPIEEVLPTHAHIPESFRGKSWAQIEQEDEERVERLVRQFRRDTFICYFDSESLARYGRRSQNKKGCGENEGVEPDMGVLTLLDYNDDDSKSVRRKRQGFRVASRCQVVKVSHSTQTVRFVIPAVGQPASEATPFSVPVANQNAAERTPDVETWRFLPLSFSNIITPAQRCTSLVYFLCSPSGPAPTSTLGSASKRCRKKRRPLDLQGLKVKYKQVPVRFYDPSSNRILKNPPKGYLWGRDSTPSCLQPPCVRQLFRSLSPDLNTNRVLGEGVSGSTRVKDPRSADTAFSHTNRFLLSTLSRVPATTDKRNAVRRRGGMSQAPTASPHRRSERESCRKKNRTPPPPSKKKIKAPAMPLQARREGLRRAGPAGKGPSSQGPPHPLSPRRGRVQRGRGCERVPR